MAAEPVDFSSVIGDPLDGAEVIPIVASTVVAFIGRTERELEDFRWLVEELRVQVFAPELKTAIPVSPPRVQEVWASLSR